jgi:hypothetical protein
MTFDEWDKEAYKRKIKNRKLYGCEIAADIWIKEYNEAVKSGVLEKGFVIEVDFQIPEKFMPRYSVVFKKEK